MKKYNYTFGLLTIAVLAAIAFLSEGGITPLSLLGFDTDTVSAGMQFASVGLVPMSLKDLRAEADKLSHFNGGRSISRYTGEGDDFLQFNGDSPDFSGELLNHLEKQFVISLVNANAATRIAVLFAGYLKGNATLAPGQLVQGAFNDKNGAAGLTGATASEKSIEELLLYLQWIPTRLIAIQLESDQQSQIQQGLTYQRLNPFKTEPTKILRPANYRNQDSFQNKLVSFPVDVQLDTLARLELPVVGTSNLTLTFFFGTSFNPVLALEKKASRAMPNVRTGAAAAEKALLLGQ